MDPVTAVLLIVIQCLIGGLAVLFVFYAGRRSATKQQHRLVIRHIKQCLLSYQTAWERDHFGTLLLIEYAFTETFCLMIDLGINTTRLEEEDSEYKDLLNFNRCHRAATHPGNIKQRSKQERPETFQVRR